MKVAELKKVEQELKTIEEFIQEFRKVIRESKYKERLLIEEFKREINGVIRHKLIKAEYFPRKIKQLYKRVINLNMDWKESRREEEIRKLRIKTNYNCKCKRWPKRQELQWMLIKLALIDGVEERTNAVMVNLQQQKTRFMLRCDLYVMDIDKKRNYYNCEGFEHIVRHCRN